MNKLSKTNSIAKHYQKAADILTVEIKNHKNIIPNLNFDNKSEAEIQELIWSVFHPEACNIINNEENKEHELYEKRKIQITKINQNPIANVAKELLFTSNALLTLPINNCSNDNIDKNLKKDLENISKDKQDYYYDHPIPIGIKQENNEIIYGLKNLAQTLKFEKEHKTIAENDNLSILISVSVTHKNLSKISKQYIKSELQKLRKDQLKGIKPYFFTETDCQNIIEEVFLPFINKYLPEEVNNKFLLKKVFGVNGNYGRHYSFLKAVSIIWQIFVNKETKATFKIDLDQVFPQQNLVNETGKTAFEHFMTDKWGADGIDSNQQAIHLGMIAGSLVNSSDINKSIFTADVNYPKNKEFSDDCVFCSTIPQALSTKVEMLTKTNKSNHQRVHVTGGTNGILVNSLRKYKSFTPSFVSRAEDQAYLLSFLQTRNENKKLMRYLHKEGLIMRHDKEAFASESIAKAKIGKIVGDYERTLIFSKYAQIFDTKIAKELLNPFTGSFISYLPLNIAYLRLAFKSAYLFKNNNSKDAVELINIAFDKFSKIHNQEKSPQNNIKLQYKNEEKAWDLYYKTLEKMNEKLNQQDEFTEKLKQKIQNIIKQTLLN